MKFTFQPTEHSVSFFFNIVFVSSNTFFSLRCKFVCVSWYFKIQTVMNSFFKTDFAGCLFQNNF